MVLWIESHETRIIALIVFGLLYFAAIVIFLVVVLLHRRDRAGHISATTPVVLSPLSVIFGLLMAFLAARVWSNLDQAHILVAQEATALRETLIMADNLSHKAAESIRKDIITYLDAVELADWPAMAGGQANLRRKPPGLPDAISVILSLVPTTPGQTLAQQRAITAIEQALTARRGRILLSEAAIDTVQWVVVTVLAVLILLIIAMVNVERPVTLAFNLLIFATAVAACMTLLMENDRPFAAGGNTVQPTALLEIRSGI
jgi:hypothetical protein